MFPLLGEVAYCPAQDARGDLRVVDVGAKAARQVSRALAPVLVIDVGAIVGRDGAHKSAPCRRRIDKKTVARAGLRSHPWNSLVRTVLQTRH